MEISVRLETRNDWRKVEELTREAFWGFTSPACNEHYLVNLIRKSEAYIPELCFVAEDEEGELIGSIVYSRAFIVSGSGEQTEVITFGPLSVLPSCQKMGVGSELLLHSIEEAKRLGYRAIVFFGHPDYYVRFGFRNAKAFGITTSEGKNFDAFMAMPLFEGALDNISGIFKEDEVFDIDDKVPEEYEKTFTLKNPVELTPIDVLLSKLDQKLHEEFIKRKMDKLALLNRYSGCEMLEWEGMDEDVLETVNQTLVEYGFSKKLFPKTRDSFLNK